MSLPSVFFGETFGFIYTLLLVLRGQAYVACIYHYIWATQKGTFGCPTTFWALWETVPSLSKPIVISICKIKDWSQSP